MKKAIIATFVLLAVCLSVVGAQGLKENMAANGQKLVVFPDGSYRIDAIQVVKAEEPKSEEPAPAVKPTFKVIVSANSKLASMPLDDLKAGQYWRQVAATEATKADAVAKAGERNTVILSSEENVIAGVRGGLFLIGILPASAETPEGCVAVN